MSDTPTPNDAVPAYTASTIKSHDGLLQIRYRPTNLIGDRGSKGQCQMVTELIANSTDELVLGHGGTIYIGILRCHQMDSDDKYQVFVIDDGRGIPADSLEAAVSRIGTSGKTGENDSAYRNSSGMYGQGGKVATALSTRYRAITHNVNDGDVAASVYFENAQLVEHMQTNANIPFGTCIVFEPDLKGFFTETDVFMSSGYLDLVALCRKTNIFNPNINFQFYLYDTPIPEEFWKADIARAREILDFCISRSDKIVEYAADSVVDKSSYLFDLWKVTSDVVFRGNILRILPLDVAPSDDKAINDYRKMNFDIKFFLTKSSATGNPQFYTSLNGVILKDKSDNILVQTFMSVIRDRVAEQLEVPEHKAFVREVYKFPTLLLAIGAGSDSVEFSGSTKNTYNVKAFGDVFAVLINNELDANRDLVSTFAKTLVADITERYNQYYNNTPSRKRETDRTTITLNYRTNYSDCKSHDPAKRELYIVEGTSASLVRVRDNEYQAIYATRGKPVNGAISSNIKLCREHILKDKVYQDLMKIINVTPYTTDMSAAKFGKIIIATDADPDGYHIRSLHLHNFYLINPRIIESGMVYLANPPLYSMDISSRKKIFLRDDTALYDARIRYLYRPTLDIRAIINGNDVPLSEETYRDCCWIAHRYGSIFTTVADQLFMSTRNDKTASELRLLILERLLFGVRYLYPKVDYQQLANLFVSTDPTGFVKVRVDEAHDTVVVSVGEYDFPIVLSTIGDMIRTNLLMYTKKIKYDHLFFKVTRRKLPDRPPIVMSMMQLYLTLKQLDGIFKTSRYKGLGELSDQDCLDSVMSPVNRSMTHITSIGDAQACMDICGNADARKRLLVADSNALSYSFMRENQRYM